METLAGDRRRLDARKQIRFRPLLVLQRGSVPHVSGQFLTVIARPGDAAESLRVLFGKPLPFKTLQLEFWTLAGSE